MDTLNQPVIEIASPHSYGDFVLADRMPPFDPRWLESHRTDAHWVVLNSDAVIDAQCSLWWRTTPCVQGARTGLIGHYAAADDRSAATLLDFVEDQLCQRGCAYVVGPMNQNTWRDYRFVLEDTGIPGESEVSPLAPFFLEPRNAPEWPAQFSRRGFQPIATYFSSVVNDLSIRAPRLARVRRRIADQGITIRPIQTNPWDADLGKILEVAKEAFAQHLFYTDMRECDFVDMYRPLTEVIADDLILVAENAERVVGFCFAVPDVLQCGRGQPSDTVIVKTLGVVPERGLAGLGQVLLEEVHHRAAARGFRKAVHALVRDVPALRRISNRYGTACRRYALFGKELSQ